MTVSSQLRKVHSRWVEVNLAALRHNLASVRNLVGPDVRIMAVVKADAYGHGAVGAARAFVEAGADFLGVTTLDEALPLREAGVDVPILVFSPLLPREMHCAISAGLDLTICDASLAELLSEAAQSVGRKARVHVKVDTGMGRLGVKPQDSAELTYRLLKLPGIEVAGIYTHFANASARNLSHAKSQLQIFSTLLESLASRDMPVGLRHTANSAAILNLPQSYLDMVRPGTILYGQYPGGKVCKHLDLQDTWCLKVRVVALNKLSVGETVGYGSEFRATRPTIVAVLPIGYSDGFTLVPESVVRRKKMPVVWTVQRLLGMQTGLSVTLHGRSAPVVGRVSMQMCCVDVTDIPEVKIGDEAIVPARRTTTSSRIPRVYLE